MRAAARNAPQVRRPSVSAAGGNLEIGRIHFGRFESDHGVPGESGAFCEASSSIKPDRVRGVIFAMVIAPSLGVLVWRRKINAPVPWLWDESVFRFVVPPKFKALRASFCLLWYGEGAVGVSAPAPPLSFVQAGRAALSGAPLSVGPAIGVLLRHPRGISVASSDCMRFWGKCQAMGRLEGLTMHRQSRSPRARPSTSTSAVAMLLAKGMLFLSHRREM